MLSCRSLGSSKPKYFRLSAVRIKSEQLIFESTVSIQPRPIQTILNVTIDHGGKKLILIGKNPGWSMEISGLDMEELQKLSKYVREHRRQQTFIGGKEAMDAKASKTENPLSVSKESVETDASNYTIGEINQPVSEYSGKKRLAEDNETIPKKRLQPFQPENTSFEIEKTATIPDSITIFGHEIENFQGFANIGNSCYLNSVLISFLFSDRISNKVGDDGKDLRRSLAYVIKCKKELPQMFAPTEFKNVLDTKTDLFKGNGQHDAHELFTSLVDLLSLEDLFTMVVRKTLKCANNHATNSSDKILGLSLDIKSNVIESIQHFFKSEEIEYKCEECGNLNCTMKYTPECTPDILAVQLKRFKVNLKFEISKISDHVILNKHITVKDSKYELYAVINHFGKYGRGHYKCSILLKCQWVSFDDEKVSLLSESQAESGYLLFYKKIHK
eukprot:NODE_95_length_21511_cov_0.501168.p3 type:complete len:444 gc:universal NODE_95_length_21511_cov_0.501168:8136-9467(+)